MISKSKKKRDSFEISFSVKQTIIYITFSHIINLLQFTIQNGTLSEIIILHFIMLYIVNLSSNNFSDYFLAE